MSAFEPIPDPGQLPTEARAFALLRHDIEIALRSVIDGIGRVDILTLPEPARLQFERVTASARTLARLVDTLPGEAPTVSSGSPAAADLGRLVAHLRRRYTAEAQDRGLAFGVDVAAGLPATLALDPVSLVRILDNLIGNALLCAGSGTVTLDIYAEPGAIAFRVRDDDVAGRSGDGAAADRGVGHHIVRCLTAALGGTVSLDPGAGRFEATVSFPAEAGSDAPTMADTSGLEGLRVLLAEDNPTNRMVASQMLRTLRAEVTVCADGVEALETFERLPFDLVVVDIEMPRMSGLDVIRAIRSRNDARSRVPIVALTAYAMREHRERIAAAGANGLISKPVTSVDALGRDLAAHALLARAALAPRPAPAAVSEAGPAVDSATYEALCEAIGPDLMPELLEKIVADLIGAQRDLAKGLEPVDRAAIRAASHILISVAGALGALRLQACAKTLNATAAGGADEGLADEVRACIREIDQAVDFVRSQAPGGFAA